MQDFSDKSVVYFQQYKRIFFFCCDWCSPGLTSIFEETLGLVGWNWVLPLVTLALRFMCYHKHIVLNTLSLNPSVSSIDSPPLFPYQHAKGRRAEQMEGGQAAFPASGVKMMAQLYISLFNCISPFLIFECDFSSASTDGARAHGNASDRISARYKCSNLCEDQ